MPNPPPENPSASEPPPLASPTTVPGGEHPWSQPPEPGRPPSLVAPGLWLFAPNLDTQGGSAWWLETSHHDLLIDCPAITEANLAFLAERRRAGRGDGGWIVLTGRQGHGRIGRLRRQLAWPLVVQEQEAYLLPGLTGLLPFASTLKLTPELQLLWTPGTSPGACVLHASAASGAAGDGLFCGRLLVPVAPGALAPLRRRDTFHWPRQLASLERLRAWLPPDSPGWIATGAGLGALRGGRIVEGGAELLAGLRPDPLARAEPALAP